ncbi:MAG: 3-isopropylmalate dehydratase [Candidatus Omnitrophica bacterium CG_4_9_14_0_2_um_filter_42_8]|nr:MAG: 3-isopropylmalate dehydratase [Candidatus Omnitrophica bacterium CG22_combo_CG10-13_8_21_14_all_43_16]PJC47243.1 MAG: 3-isopropylmalate dehydratase [Candidatus Omnitrophica bacterium CG_4_9_14_0_2_um_filter_42_8]
MKGISYKFGDDINTDLIISGRYKFSITDPNQLARHVFEDIDPEFYKKVGRDKFFVIAGSNFGCGSSREQAPLALKHAGCQAVLAKSFARIFYRNAFNLGLPLVECDTGKIKKEDIIEVDIEKGIVVGPEKQYTLQIKPFTRFQKNLVEVGGIANYYKKYGELKIEP